MKSDLLTFYFIIFMILILKIFFKNIDEFSSITNNTVSISLMK